MKMITNIEAEIGQKIDNMFKHIERTEFKQITMLLDIYKYIYIFCTNDDRSVSNLLLCIVIPSSFNSLPHPKPPISIYCNAMVITAKVWMEQRTVYFQLHWSCFLSFSASFIYLLLFVSIASVSS